LVNHKESFFICYGGKKEKKSSHVSGSGCTVNIVLLKFGLDLKIDRVVE